MADGMPPSPSAMNAPLIKMESSSTLTEAGLLIAGPVNLEEGEIEEQKIGTSPSRSVVEYSISPPPLIEDSSGNLVEQDGTESPDKSSTLRGELELATYEYAALEERYCKLWDQHRELRKLASAYNDAIQGSSTSQDQTASIEQLRAEAGRSGLRVKALEADVLRPMIREAGGLQALLSQTISIRWLIEQAGGLKELEELVSQAYMLRNKVDEVGGLQGLGHLVAEVNLLRLKQQEYTEPIIKSDEFNELKAKAAKYDRLEQTFIEMRNLPNDVANGRSLSQPSSAPVQAPLNITEASTRVNSPHPRSDTSSVAVTSINPARANRISATPIETDPDRDLYEAVAPVMNPQNKTGSNNVPLGSSHVSTRSFDNSHRRAKLKRKEHDQLPANATKRPRINVGRASALVQSTLISQGTDRPKHDLMKVDWRSARISDSERTRHSGRLESHVESPSGTEAPPPTTLAAAVSLGGHPKNEMRVPGFLQPILVTGSVHSSRLPMIKTEDIEDGEVNHHPMTLFNNINDMNLQPGATVRVRAYPIAVWIGSRKPETYFSAVSLKKSDEIPSELANFLSGELTKYISDTKVDMWNSMPANPDTCILRYLVEGYRPFGKPQERRVCKHCWSAYARHHRPCALLQDVDGVRTVVFLPLQDALRRGVSWKDKKYWVMDG